MSRKCPEKYIKAHISSFINLRTESKPENVKHISIYPERYIGAYIFFIVQWIGFKFEGVGCIGIYLTNI
jgi:hypothetical protein